MKRIYDARNRTSPNDDAHPSYVSLPCEPWLKPSVKVATTRCEVCGLVIAEGLTRCNLHLRSLPHQRSPQLR